MARKRSRPVRETKLPQRLESHFNASRRENAKALKELRKH